MTGINGMTIEQVSEYIKPYIHIYIYQQSYPEVSKKLYIKNICVYVYEMNHA